MVTIAAASQAMSRFESSGLMTTPTTPRFYQLQTHKHEHAELLPLGTTFCMSLSRRQQQTPSHFLDPSEMSRLQKDRDGELRGLRKLPLLTQAKNGVIIYHKVKAAARLLNRSCSTFGLTPLVFGSRQHVCLLTQVQTYFLRRPSKALDVAKQHAIRRLSENSPHVNHAMFQEPLYCGRSHVCCFAWLQLMMQFGEHRVVTLIPGRC